MRGPKTPIFQRLLFRFVLFYLVKKQYKQTKCKRMLCNHSDDKLSGNVIDISLAC